MPKHEFKVGDFAQSIESGWKGKIVAIETDPKFEGAPLRMVGVDGLAQIVGGLTDEEALTSDDVQWFDGADLIPV